MYNKKPLLPVDFIMCIKPVGPGKKCAGNHIGIVHGDHLFLGIG